MTIRPIAKDAKNGYESYRLDDRERKLTDSLKMTLWEYVLFLWMVQCKQAAELVTENKKRSWQLRAMGAERVLLPERVHQRHYKEYMGSGLPDTFELVSDQSIDSQRSVRSSKQTLSDIYEIYFLAGEGKQECLKLRRISKDGYWVQN